ncbi:UDP-N-acetylmuramate dehydrogenase [Endozoicomonas sp. Mp262]|uniref:UDP-N-acetylmuramate dehydrogenase n=1 Tax=Endozoicomonas sp. Mp262 TaxID=2919499 RepID=UPI0021DA1DC3
MNILENIDLGEKNTFGLKARARYFAEASSVDELVSLLAFARQRGIAVVPLGGGSNVIFSRDIDALVIRVALQGKAVVQSCDRAVRVAAKAGENWHSFVRWTLSQGAFGLENLSLIPGAVGAAPIQNIGAYGVELKDFFYSLEAIDIETGHQVTLDKNHCRFGYRDSVFKGQWQDRYIITSVQLELDKALKPRLDYGNLKERVQARCGSGMLSAQLISDTVCDIRREKLPDPAVLGNAGSFFKNPLVETGVVQRLRKEYPDISAFPVSDNHCKVAAGWLIDKVGLKGYQEGAVGTYQQQALVLVNHGGATGDEVMRFSGMIQERVRERFGIILEREPRIF